MKTLGFISISDDELHPPMIISVKDSYDPDDDIKIGCQPRFPSTGPQPNIKWYLQHRMVRFILLKYFLNCNLLHLRDL